MSKKNETLDPIGLEVLHNGLKSITDEMFVALMRSAFSGNIKERRDHSTAIIDTQGQLVAQAAQSLPIHLSGLLGLVDAIRAAYPLEEISPGDMFIANDPYEGGGSHLPDINTAEPVFVDGELVCFVCTIAHHSDIGGARAGSMAAGLTEIYQEGIRIPLVKLFSKGEMVRDVYNILLLNMRMRNERLGDFNAQFAASRLGLRRFGELSAKYGAGTLKAAFDEILAATERRMRQAISEIPDGSFAFEDLLDSDGTGHLDIPIKVVIDVSGDEIALDFEGTGAQVPGNINLVLNGLHSTVAFALKVLLDPQAANNSGLIRPVRISAREGTVVNAVYPAAVAHRVQTAMRVVDVIMGALADVMPHRVTAAANGSNTSAMFYGRNPATGSEYVYFETLGGGGGARSTKRGKDGVQAYLTNTSNLPVEAGHVRSCLTSWLKARDRSIVTAEAAKAAGTTGNFAAQMVHLLVKAKLIDTKRGPGVGVGLAQPAHRILLGEVIARLQPGLIGERMSDEGGERELMPGLSKITAGADIKLRSYLDRYSIADLAERPESAGCRSSRTVRRSVSGAAGGEAAREL
jgi:N-methylhydantoinase B